MEALIHEIETDAGFIKVVADIVDVFVEADGWISRTLVRKHWFGGIKQRSVSLEDISISEIAKLFPGYSGKFVFLDSFGELPYCRFVGMGPLCLNGKEL